MAKVNNLMNGWETKVLCIATTRIASQVGIISVITVTYHLASVPLGTAEIPILPTESTCTRLNLLLLIPRVFHLGWIQRNQLSSPYYQYITLMRPNKAETAVYDSFILCWMTVVAINGHHE